MEKLPTIFLEQKVHRKTKQLLIKFKYHQKLIDLIKSVDGSSWSTSLNSWYLKNSNKNLQTILDLFYGITEVDSSKISKKKDFSKEPYRWPKKTIKFFLSVFKRKKIQPKHYTNLYFFYC